MGQPYCGGFSYLYFHNRLEDFRQYKEDSKPMKDIIKRFLRVGISTIAGAWFVKLQNDAKYAALIPIISAIGKAIRVKYPKAEDWLPF
jgi:hypothetical protein